jgi:molybdopterin/thiamine biosynthesis adenylyltransferase
MNATLQDPALRRGDRACRDAHVVVVGLGGLGTPAVRALAEAGVGRLTLWDPDVVERSNLPRQLLYEAADIGAAKIDVVAAWLGARHPALATRTVGRRLGAGDARTLIDATVVIDGTDSIESKFALSDAAMAAGVPLVHAGAVGLRAQLTTILPGRTPCYRCVFEEPPPAGDLPSCAEAGILAPFVNFVGTVQAAEALRIVQGAAPAFAGRLLVLDAGRGTSRTVPLHRRHDCPACAAGAEELPMRSEP